MRQTLLAMMSVAVMAPAIAGAADQVRVRSASAAVHQSPEPGAAVVANVAKGTIVDVVRREGGWYWVLLPADPSGTRRAGYIRAADVEEVRVVAPPEGTPAPEPQTRPAGGTGPPLPVAAAPVSQARRGGLQPSWRAVIAVGAGYSAATSIFDDLATFTLNREDGRREATYRLGGGVLVDGGVVVRLWHGLAVGLDVSVLTQDGSADVTVSLPHPFFFDRPREAAATSGVRHSEIGLHPNARWVLSFSRDRASLSVFAGASFFRVDQDVITDLSYREEYPYDTVVAGTPEVRRQSASALGSHAGADFTYLFTRTLGAGAVIRYTHASVELAGGGGQPIVVTAGGPQVAGGIRLRF